MKFNELLKHHRIERGVTLRSCSASLGVDPSNWSKFERGVLPAPKAMETLDRWAEVLGITDTQSFLDAAAISRNEIPADLVSDEKLVASLPVFFRAIRGDQMQGLLNDLQKVHGALP